MSLAELFYAKETVRERLRRWRQAGLRRQTPSNVARRPHPPLCSPEPSRRPLTEGEGEGWGGGVARSSFTASVSALSPQHSALATHHPSPISHSPSRLVFESLESRLLLSAAPMAPIEAPIDPQGAEPVVMAADAAISPQVDNQPPVAGDLNVTMPPGQGHVDIRESQLLGVSSDPDGDQLIGASPTSQPSNGTLSFVFDEEFILRYIRNSGFIVGQDSFKYRVADAQGTLSSNEGTVTINVGTTANLAPTALNDLYQVDEGGTLTVPGLGVPKVLANDTDPENDPLTAEVVRAPLQAALFTFNADGSFTYTHDGTDPLFGDDGLPLLLTDSFEYVANDGQANSNPATVTIVIRPVNDQPKANPDFNDITEDQSPNQVTGNVITDPSGRDEDPDDPVLRVSEVNGSSANVDVDIRGTFGTVKIETGGKYTYTLDNSSVQQLRVGQTVEENFSYTVVDQHGAHDDAGLTIRIHGANDAPFAVDDFADTNEDTPVVIRVVDLNRDEDVDAGEQAELRIVAVTPGTQGGTVVIEPDGRSVVYTPNKDFNGVDTFTYTIGDGNGEFDDATVTVTVDAVNEAPDAVDDGTPTPIEVLEDHAVFISVLANDRNPDGGSLDISQFDSETPKGRVNRFNNFLVYAAKQDANGTDNFTYTISDGQGDEDTATVFVNITPVNDAPRAVSEAFNAIEDRVSRIPKADLLANDIDPDNVPPAPPNAGLTVIGVSNPVHGTVALDDGNVVFTPDEHFNGEAFFDYTIRDSENAEATATVTLIVAAINDAPTANPDSDGLVVLEGGTLIVPAPGAPRVLDNDTDPENDRLTAMLVSGPQHAKAFTLNSDGSFTYTHDGSETTEDRFTYKANDGQADSDPTTVTITITPVNNPPVVVDDGDPISLTTPEDQALTIDVVANDLDVDGPLPLVPFNVSDPPHGTAELNQDGTILYRPDLNYSGPDSFTYQARDQKDLPSQNTATVFLEVTPLNDAPVAVSEAFNAIEDRVSLIPKADLLANDFDPDNVPPAAPNAGLTVIGVSNPVRGTVALDDEKVVFTPDANFRGEAFFDYTIRDSDNAEATATVTLIVAAINDPPSFTRGPDQSVTEVKDQRDLESQSVPNWATNISPGPPDESAQETTFEVLENTNPNLFTALPVIAKDGTLTYTLAPNATGAAFIRLVLKDNGGTANGGEDTSAPQAFTITVQPSDTDGDGVSDVEENTVGSPFAATNAREAALRDAVTGLPVSLVGPVGTTFSGVRAFEPPINAPIGMLFPIGLFSFSINGIEPGSIVPIQVFVPPEANLRMDDNPVFLKEDSVTDDVFVFPFDEATGTGAQFFDDDEDGFVDRIVVTIQDGGLGDFDGTANGRVQDPGGPAFLATLDVDGDGAANTTDGKLILRDLAGTPASQLTAGLTFAPNATRTTGEAIRRHLDLVKTGQPLMLDADGDGLLNPFTDGRLIHRYLADQVNGPSVTGAVMGANAQRTTSAAIRDFLATFLPLGSSSANAGLSTQHAALSTSTLSSSLFPMSPISTTPPHPPLSPEGRGQGIAAMPLQPTVIMSPAAGASDQDDQPAFGVTLVTSSATALRPWLQEFVVESSTVPVEDPNRDLVVTVAG